MIAYFQNLAGQFTNPVTALAQILGFIPMFLGFFVFYYNDRKKAIAVKAACDGMFVAHFSLLGQWTGAAVCAVNVLRGLLFAQRGKKKWLSLMWVPVLICLLTIGGSILGWTGWESVLPMVGSVLAVIGYWCNDTRLLRRFNFAGISLWLVYGIITMSVPTIIGNCVYLISIIRTEISLLISKRKNS